MVQIIHARTGADQIEEYNCYIHVYGPNTMLDFAVANRRW